MYAFNVYFNAAGAFRLTKGRIIKNGFIPLKISMKKLEQN